MLLADRAPRQVPVTGAATSGMRSGSRALPDSGARPCSPEAKRHSKHALLHASRSQLRTRGTAGHMGGRLCVHAHARCRRRAVAARDATMQPRRAAGAVLSGAHRAVQGSNVLVQDGVQLSVADIRVPGASPRRPSVVLSMTIQELRGRSMLACKACACSLGARPDLPKLLTGVLVTPRTRTVTHHGAKIACHLLLGCTAQWAHFVSRGSPECARLAQGSCHSASSALERSGAHTALKQFRQGGRWRAHTLSSAHPRGKPLYPMPSMILSGPTMQAPTYTRAVSSAAAWWRPKQSKLARQRTCLLGSLDRRALRNATAIK